MLHPPTPARCEAAAWFSEPAPQGWTEAKMNRPKWTKWMRELPRVFAHVSLGEVSEVGCWVSHQSSARHSPLCPVRSYAGRFLMPDQVGMSAGLKGEKKSLSVLLICISLIMQESELPFHTFKSHLSFFFSELSAPISWLVFSSQVLSLCFLYF